MKETNEKPKLVNCFYDGAISGFGDFLRGSIHLYQRCKSHNLDFDIDIKNHPINEFISSKYKDSVKKEVDYFFGQIIYVYCLTLFHFFIFSLVSQKTPNNLHFTT